MESKSGIEILPVDAGAQMRVGVQGVGEGVVWPAGPSGILPVAHLAFLGHSGLTHPLSWNHSCGSCPPFLLYTEGYRAQNVPFGLGICVLKENIASFLTEYKILE